MEFADLGRFVRVLFGNALLRATFANQNETTFLPLWKRRFHLGGQSKSHTCGQLKTAHQSVGSSKSHT